MPRTVTRALGIGLGFGLACAAALAIAMMLRPELRLAARAAWNDPRLLAAFADDARIRYEPEARACAAETAALLPAAIAQIEAAHGRPFAQPPTVGVYASYENYAKRQRHGRSRHRRRDARRRGAFVADAVRRGARSPRRRSHA